MIDDQEDRSTSMRTSFLVRQLQEALERAHHTNGKLMDANVRAVEQYSPLVEQLLANQQRLVRLESFIWAIANGQIDPDRIRQHARELLKKEGSS